MNWSEFILSFLEGKQDNLYALRRAVAEGLESSHATNSRSESADQVLRNTISRLKRQGFIMRNTGGVYKIVKKGYDRLEKMRLRKSFPKHTSAKPVRKKTQHDTVIVFDIPEKQRRSRGWLRSELRALGFVLLQKSTWIGSGPLPKDFLIALKELNILRCVHIFSIQKKGTLN